MHVLRLNEQSQGPPPLKASTLIHISSWNCTDPSQEAELRQLLWAVGPLRALGKYKGKKADTYIQRPYGQTKPPGLRETATYSHWRSLSLYYQGPCVQGPAARRASTFQAGSHGICDGSLMPMVFHPGPLNLA